MQKEERYVWSIDKKNKSGEGCFFLLLIHFKYQIIIKTIRTLEPLRDFSLPLSNFASLQ